MLWDECFWEFAAGQQWGQWWQARLTRLTPADPADPRLTPADPGFAEQNEIVFSGAGPTRDYGRRERSAGAGFSRRFLSGNRAAMGQWWQARLTPADPARLTPADPG
jgi:hypothetical protein